ncbi:interferon-induced transmembrane protein 1-like [Ambystoma mexicanum]|uniref:interferon-induced transmembrane protein 1-like n=1 Tax=Ambystoma mexicanum TaxID=8296 RepID=UPI0037E868EC
MERVQYTQQTTNSGTASSMYPPPYNPIPPGFAIGQPPMYSNAVPAYQYPQNNVVITQSPIPVVTTQTTTVVTSLPVYEVDYLGYSIFTMLCCFCPLGLVACIFSMKTRESNRRGDVANARQNSRTAKILNNVTLGIGIAIAVAYVTCVIYYLVRGQISSSSSSSSYSCSSSYYGYYYCYY